MIIEAKVHNGCWWLIDRHMMHSMAWELQIHLKGRVYPNWLLGRSTKCAKVEVVLLQSTHA